MKYNRILLKLSGESLMGEQGFGIDPKHLERYAREIATNVKKGIQLAIVIGGGNIFRGLSGTGQGYNRVQGDYMGMLATTINSLALQDALTQQGIAVRLLSGLPIERIAEAMSGKKAQEYLEKGETLIIAGGTGNPFFTTDTTSALRALEINADVMLKGTRVDGIYDSDPEKNPTATHFETISYEEIIRRELKVMDLTAFTMCKENNLPIIVFNMDTPGNLSKVLAGEKCGTYVDK
ncbi:MAG: UMP kinase [Bacteroidetes bacterium]|nr:MAG: UMP kinase [Bacteroidota bacterium]PIE88513.1 MAG: UMP kinase [Bacteroidota bacterium]